MKLLQNPWVTGSLVLVAVAVAGYQFMPRDWHRRAAAPSPRAHTPVKSAAPAPKAQPVKVAAKQEAEPKLTPDMVPQKEIDRQFAESNFSTWVNSPQRDPFLLLDGNANEDAELDETNSPVRTWKLDALWHQTGSQLAVINNHVYEIGQEIVKGYSLMKIEGDEVWIQGPKRTERLGFRKLGRIADAAATNPPAASGTNRLSAAKSL